MGEWVDATWQVGTCKLAGPNKLQLGRSLFCGMGCYITFLLLRSVMVRPIVPGGAPSGGEEKHKLQVGSPLPKVSVDASHTFLAPQESKLATVTHFEHPRANVGDSFMS